MSRSNVIKVELPLQDFKCPLTLEIIKEPLVASCCGTLFEKKAIEEAKKITRFRCPCCRSFAVFSPTSSAIIGILKNIYSTISGDGPFSFASSSGNSILKNIYSAISAVTIARKTKVSRKAEDIAGDQSSLFINFTLDFIYQLISLGDKSRVAQNTIDEILKQHPQLYGHKNSKLQKEYVPFNMDEFAQIIRENKLKTAAGERLIAILKNNPAHLNKAGVVALLANNEIGRFILRQNLNIKEFYGEKLLCFGNAVLSFESLKTKVKSVPILELLSKEIATDLNKTGQLEIKLRQVAQTQYQLLIDESHKRLSIEAEAQKEFLALVATKQGLFRKNGALRGVAAPGTLNQPKR